MGNSSPVVARETSKKAPAQCRGLLLSRNLFGPLAYLAGQLPDRSGYMPLLCLPFVVKLAVRQLFPGMGLGQYDNDSIVVSFGFGVGYLLLGCFGHVR